MNASSLKHFSCSYSDMQQNQLTLQSHVLWVLLQDHPCMVVGDLQGRKYFRIGSDKAEFVSNDNLLKVTSKLILCFLWSFTHLVLLECSAKVSAFMVVVRIAGLDPAACSSWNLRFIPHIMLLCLPSDLLFHKFLYFQALWAIASFVECVSHTFFVSFCLMLKVSRLTRGVAHTWYLGRVLEAHEWMCRKVVYRPYTRLKMH